MIKCFYERAKELADNCQELDNHNVYKTLAEEYHIDERVAVDRFRSYFGKSVRDYVEEKNTPTKKELIDAMIISDNNKEVMKNLNVKPQWFNGIYDKYFKVSTFTKAKAKLLKYREEIPFNPSVKDNLSLFLSQRLGNGMFSYTETKNGGKSDYSMMLRERSNQIDYLKFKVNLFCKAFPQLNGLGAILSLCSDDDNEGIQYHIWETGDCNLKAIKQSVEMSKQDAIKRLTPLGWMLWFLDSAELEYYNSKIIKMVLPMSSSIEAVAAVETLDTYGIAFGYTDESIETFNCERINKFLDNFIKPFINIIPASKKKQLHLETL